LSEPDRWRPEAFWSKPSIVIAFDLKPPAPSDAFNAPRMAALVSEAALRLGTCVRRTAVEPIDLTGLVRSDSAPRTFAKLEQLQVTGSFKIRGATNKLMSLTPESAAAGVIAASTGNHGLAVATAAVALGIDAEIFLSRTVSEGKRDKIQRAGARIRVVGEDPLTAELAARAEATASGRSYISPYNDPMVIAGQGTLAVELAEQLPKLDAVLIAVGGGGLIGGVGAYFRHHLPQTRIIGCWPENSPVLYECLRAGQFVTVPERPTLSDSTAGDLEPGAITLALAQQVVDAGMLVSEEQIAAAMRVAQDQGWRIEGAAGVALAALIARADEFAGQTVAVIFCGGNRAADAS
jgi:threonine dehydratase